MLILILGPHSWILEEGVEIFLLGRPGLESECCHSQVMCSDPFKIFICKTEIIIYIPHYKIVRLKEKEMRGGGGTWESTFYSNHKVCVS